jgi:hypothetical protein
MHLLLQQIALGFNGLIAGMLLGTALAGVPWMRRPPAADYVRMHQFWSPRFDPLGPILVVGTLLCDVGLAILAPTRTSRNLLTFVAIALIAIMVVSSTRNARLKRRVMKLDPDNLPADWAERDPRSAFAKWNLVRTVLAVIAFLGNIAAVAV